MSGTHGVFQHRTGYFYTILEEDFCEMYKAEGVNEVCRAYITSILENLTNKQFDGTGNKEEIWVYISLPEMARRMRHAYSERTIHKEVQGMIKDEYLKKRRAINKATMEYCLNLKKIRDGLTSLPDKQSCNSATSNLANLQDQSGNSARLTLQNCNNDLAELQPRITNRINKEETKEEESIANEPSVEPLAPSVALSPTSQSSLSSFPQEETQEKQSPIVTVTARNDQSVEQKSLMPDLPKKSSSKTKQRDTEPLLPVMPLQDAPWPSRETAVQIVEAKKGRKYSDATRKQELQEAGKVLDMTVDGASITREQFEKAWDEISSSTWWDEHSKPCMIKYLRRDDTIVGIIKKLKRKGRPSSPLQATIVDMDAERERVRIKNEQQLAKQQEMRRKRAELAKQGVNNG